MIVGEAVKRFSSDFRDQHPIILWPLIAGMRDRLIHGYDSVDLDQVWATASRDIPALLSRIESLSSPPPTASTP